jgi:uncharacterized protein
MGRIVSAVMIGVARGWQLSFSAFMPPTCRYHPSCSAFAIEAIRSHGPWVGGWLALKRLGRCHPWGGYGFDPVPEKKN